MEDIVVTLPYIPRRVTKADIERISKIFKDMGLAMPIPPSPSNLMCITKFIADGNAALSRKMTRVERVKFLQEIQNFWTGKKVKYYDADCTVLCILPRTVYEMMETKQSVDFIRRLDNEPLHHPHPFKLVVERLIDGKPHRQHVTMGDVLRQNPNLKF